MAATTAQMTVHVATRAAYNTDPNREPYFWISADGKRFFSCVKVSTPLTAQAVDTFLDEVDVTRGDNSRGAICWTRLHLSRQGCTFSTVEAS